MYYITKNVYKKGLITVYCISMVHSIIPMAMLMEPTGDHPDVASIVPINVIDGHI